MQVKPRTTGKDLGFLTPTKKRQTEFVGASLAIATGSVVLGSFTQQTRVKLGIHTYKMGVRASYSYFALRPVLPALRREKKIGFRFGSKGVMPLGALTGPMGMYILPHMRRLPIPTFGFGFTAVPKEESRFPGITQSRGGEHTTSSGTPETATETIVGPLARNRQADRRPSSITPLVSRQGGGGKTAGGTKRAVRPRRTSPPYCWRHKKRHYCIFTK